MDVWEIMTVAQQRRAETGTPTETLSYDEALMMKAERVNKIAGSLKGYECLECLNRGYHAAIIEQSGNKYLVYRDCKCKAVRIAMERIRRSGLELQISECRFDNFEVTTEYQRLMKEKAQQFVNDPEKWFVLCGQSGCGKTHICTAICGVLLNTGSAVAYMNYRDDMTQLKQNITDAESYGETMNRFKQTQVLYIDDFFKGKITEADVNATFELLNYRYNNRLKTIISTELMLEDIIGIDEAIAGRIRQMACEYFIQIGRDINKNYRLRGKNG